MITLKLPNGTTQSAKCNDGEWEEALTQAEDADYHFQADEAYVDGSGALTYTGDIAS